MDPPRNRDFIFFPVNRTFTRKAQLTQRGTCNSGAGLKAQ